jgi:DNA-binding MarR family transcriptional regulator
MLDAPVSAMEASVDAAEFGRALDAQGDLVELFEQTLSDAESARSARPALRLVKGGATDAPAAAISPRLFEALAAIARSIETRGFPPTLRELCDAMGVRSTNAASDHLRRLERAGLIDTTAAQARAIRITDAGRVVLAAGAS